MARTRLFSRVGKTPVIPIGLKILFIFVCLILLSNFATNFISLRLTQREVINLNNTIMVEQLKELYNNSANQYEIYSYSKDKYESSDSMKKASMTGFAKRNSVALGLKPDGAIDFFACNNPEVRWTRFIDKDALMGINQNYADGISEGSISFKTFNGEYFGVYKFQDSWGYYLIRAEKRADLNRDANRIFLITSMIIVVLTLLFIIVGSLVLNNEFKVLHTFTNQLYEMQQKKHLGLIDLSKAKNDDVTYLAASFNNLSVSVNNLLVTFQKFVSKDVVAKAYTEHGIALEGTQRELTMLFSDIKSFTYRTETLGNEIIDVLNVHYNRVIHCVHENQGVIGSIIGDAVLAVFGTMETKDNKSISSVDAAWSITKVTAQLRNAMEERRKEIESKRPLTESEERVYQAVMLEVGVGIDGGSVFYGNIGSNEHMANTVIGDNVNSASRLEGLTRVYHLPVIVSEYIKNEVQRDTDQYMFFEIDTVQVKGKTEGKKIYLPLDKNQTDSSVLEKYEIFEQGLSSYYSGNWVDARQKFKECNFEVGDIFLERIGLKKAPADWSGIWTMTTK